MPRSIILVFLLAPAFSLGQLTPFNTMNVATKPWDTRGLLVPPNSTSSAVQFTVDSSSEGGDVIDVVVDNPAVVISLTSPTGAQVTANTATGLGYQFYVFTSSPSTAPNPFSSPGTHTLIVLPVGAPQGIYTVSADSTAAASPSLLTASYYSSSMVTAGLTPDASTYRVGDSVVLTGLLFDGTGPVTNATVTASIAAPVDLSSQVSIGNYQLVGQQSIDANTTQYTYTASLTNPGPPIQGASADATSTSSNVTVLSGGLYFGDVGTGATVASQNTFAIEASASRPPDLSVLQWVAQMPGTPASVALSDSGSSPDSAQGDGLYSGLFTPPQPGEYVASISATGLSLEGLPFSRTAITSFTVVSPSASLGSVSDEGLDTNGDGLIDQIVVTASVTAQKAGTYLFSVILLASDGQTAYSSTTADLTVGSQTISVQFQAADILELGVDGPYEKTQAFLALINGATQAVADLKADAGPTAAYTIASLDRGPLYLTGQDSAVGVITGAGPTFDLLQVSMGVSSSTSQFCTWSGGLSDPSGNSIDFVSSSGQLAAGANTLTLNFNGNKIARAANGPYLVKAVSVICGSQQAIANTLFQTQAFTASQFTSATPDFTLAVTYNPPGAPQETKYPFQLSVGFLGGFNGAINLSVSGLPAGANGTFSVPTLMIPAALGLEITISPTTAAGSYPLTITGTSGTLSHGAPAVLKVIGAVATPIFSPVAGTYSFPQTVSITSGTPGASIRYTTDGSPPSETAGTLYSGPVTVSSTTVINAIAYASGFPDSAVASATYTINVPPPNTAQFVKADTTTQGSWQGVYGANGSNVIGDTTAYPSYVTVTPSGQTNWVWSSSTSDVRGLQKASLPADRIAATWYSATNFSLDINITDGATHQLAVYCVDWDGNGSRAETIDILDGVSNTVLDTRTVSSFQNGEYLVWNLGGHVILRVTSTGAPNAVLSGLFFDLPVVAAPAFSPEPASYGSAQTVTISTITPGASIRYTTDGSTPSETAGMLYGGPVTVSSTTTIKAIAYASGLTDSAVASATYTIIPGLANTAQFVKTDTTTQGSWQGVYGANGYNVIGDTAAYPSYVTVTPSGQTNWVWSSSTSDVRGLQKASLPTDRIAATWYSATNFSLDINITDGATHQLAVYCVDWDGNGSRAETIDILDGVTNTVLDTRTISNFQNGEYLVWNLGGHVILRVTSTGSPNAVLSGLFFETP